MRVIGILGGTFDPVHCGHLRLAVEMREQLALDSVRLMPAGNPRLREPPVADAATRLRLLGAAIEGVDGLEIDDRELARDGETYTIDTLRELRAELPEAALCLLLGMDAFARLDQWGGFDALPDLAHIGVARRPGSATPADGPVADLIAERGTRDPADLAARPAGHVCVRDIPALDVSATRIRELRADGRSIRWLVPDRVHDIIHDEDLYARSRR